MSFDFFQIANINEFTYGNGKTYSSFLLENQSKESLIDCKKIIGLFSVASPIVADMIKNMKNGQEFVLVLSKEAKEKIKSKEWNLADAKDHDGFFRAIVKDKDGSIVEHGMIKKKDIPAEINVGQIALAMQGMAIQKSLDEIKEQLEDIARKLDDVVAGQHNDRISLYYSACNKYREALLIEDPQLQKIVKAEAISSLNDSIESVKQDTIYAIGTILDDYDDKKESFKHPKHINEKIPRIKNNLQFIHKAVALKTAIYVNEKEYFAAVQSLNDYKFFLNDSLNERNIQLLYYADDSSKKLNCFWTSKGNQLPTQITKACNSINNMDLYSLEYTGDGI